MTISLNKVLAFVAVADTGNITLAAKRLGKDRSTLSQMIAAMEDELGVALFERSGKLPILTSAGERLLGRAKRLCAESEAFHEFAYQLLDEEKSTLSLAISPLIPAQLVSQAMAQLRQRFANVQLEVLQLEKEQIRAALLAQTIDVGLTLNPNPTSTAPMAVSYLANMSMEFVAGPQALLPELLDASALASSRQLIHQELADSTLAPLFQVGRSLEVIGSVELLLEMVAANQGWSILPAAIVAPHIERGTLRRLQVKELVQLPVVPITLWLAPSVADTSVVQGFGEALIAQAQQLGMVSS
ncbi:LysR family transcriptional regulator [Ferrimonas marina]|uniref:DNA-binding transcriptional regulator, LysR family n=1 Tax=Ferrimonas marina TaxID=299255 RepID=A0A1M5P5H2_9GAMM|nr:LysR family transcriptional regulator [Ferrimonas marina]SHG96463.1 DNA-binding transcriptional regulator, LysR family [Ferrimonas marina]